MVELGGRNVRPGRVLLRERGWGRRHGGLRELVGDSDGRTYRFRVCS